VEKGTCHALILLTFLQNTHTTPGKITHMQSLTHFSHQSRLTISHTHRAELYALWVCAF